MSSGTNTRLKKWDILVYDLSDGGSSWSWVSERSLDLDILNFKADGGFEMTTVDLPEVLPTGASAGETIKLTSVHTVVDYDAGSSWYQLSTDGLPG